MTQNRPVHTEEQIKAGLRLAFEQALSESTLARAIGETGEVRCDLSLVMFDGVVAHAKSSVHFERRQNFR